MITSRNLCFAAVFTTAMFGADVRSEWNVRDHIPLEQFTIQSHRGGGELLPENSMETFKHSWSLGNVPEADVRATKDGVIVAFHDNDFSRVLANATPEQRKQGIKDVTWQEVSRLDVGAFRGAQFAGQRVPRMEDVFRFMAQDRKRRMYVDIKNVDMVQLARMAKSAGVEEQLTVASTEYPVLLLWKAVAPKSSTLLWMGGTEQVLAKRLDDLAESQFASVTQLQIHVFVKDGVLSPSPEFLMRAGAELRKRNILFQVFPWYSKDPSVFKRLMDLGVASFASDYPEVTRQAVREYYGERKR